MSKTEDHKPIYAKMSDKKNVREVHDHTTGFCDLPPLDTWTKELSQNIDLTNKYRCSWSLKDGFVVLDSPESRKSHFEHKKEVKKQRSEAKNWCRTLKYRFSKH